MIKRLILWVCFFLTSFSFAGDHAQSEYQFIVISDTHVGVSHKMELLPKGRNWQNDLDEETFDTLIHQVKVFLKKSRLHPDSLVLLGDLVDHLDGSIEAGSYAGRKKQLGVNFSHLLAAFHPMPIVYAFGNNDSLSGDYLAFHDETNPVHTPWDVARQAGWKSGVLSTGKACESVSGQYPCLVRHAEYAKTGAATVQLAPALRLIILNSVLYDGDHDWIYHGKHYDGQPAWFDAQLKAAQIAGDSVLVAMHVPPGLSFVNGKPFWQGPALAEFLDSLAKYPGTVIGVLAGHTHMEELRMIMQGKTLIPVIFTAGLSTQHGNASSFKYFTLQRNKKSRGWEIQNYQTFYYADPHFKKLYDFRTAYCPGPSPVSVAGCLKHYVTQGKQSVLMDKIGLYYTAGNPNYTVKWQGTDPAILQVTP